MWTSKNRGRYDRSKLRYPSDLTDDEWKLIELLIPPGKPGGGKRTVIMREVVNPKEPTPDNLRSPVIGEMEMSPLNGAHTTYPLGKMTIPQFASD